MRSLPVRSSSPVGVHGRRGVARRARGPSVGLSLLLALTPAIGCQKLARGPGKPGAAPVEKVPEDSAEAPVVAPQGLPDPCRGTPLPADQHFVAHGMCARVVATHQGELRQITFAPNGDLFGVTIPGAIRRYRDVNHDGTFQPDEVVEWANTGNENGNNCEIDARGGYLYAGTKEGVRRWKYAPDIDRGGPGEEVMVGQPGGGNHPFHPVHVYDGFMYVDSGSEHNAALPEGDVYDTDRSVVKRFDLAKFDPGHPFPWREGEVFVSGVRNVTGFTRNAAGRMIGVLSGIDDLRYKGSDIHADNPGEEIVALEQGKAYGYPFCFAAARVVIGGSVVAPGTKLQAGWASQNPLTSVTESPKDDAWCGAHSDAPLTFMQAHSSPLGIAFFDGPDGALPPRFRGGAFVALHGSWDRTPTTGYKVIWVPFDAGGKAPMPTSTAEATTFPYEVVFGGGAGGVAKDGSWSWSSGNLSESPVRPVGVAVSPVDGALYISSDNGTVPLQRRSGSKADGALYRVGLVWTR
jgi:glucose/arabinose dehydrogenase